MPFIKIQRIEEVVYLTFHGFSFPVQIAKLAVRLTHSVVHQNAIGPCWRELGLHGDAIYYSKSDCWIDISYHLMLSETRPWRFVIWGNSDTCSQLNIILLSFIKMPSVHPGVSHSCTRVFSFRWLSNPVRNDANGKRGKILRLKNSQFEWIPYFFIHSRQK